MHCIVWVGSTGGICNLKRYLTKKINNLNAKGFKGKMHIVFCILK